MIPEKRYDLAVAYRIYPAIAKAAAGLPFGDSKYHLAEVCLRSFRRSLGNLRAKLWVLLDNCPPEYTDLFRKYFRDEDLVFVPLPGLGNHLTLLKQIEILLEQDDAELVYFAEDDYFYLANQFPLMIDFMQSFPDVDFISAYDHPDCYTLDLHRGPKWLRIHGNHHWRTAASTCHTFLTSRRVLKKVAGTFRKEGLRDLDCSQFMCLTKQNLAKGIDLFRWIVRDRHVAKLLLAAWVFGLPEILFGKRYRLWMPVPAIATHVNAPFLAPGRDWVRLMQDERAAGDLVNEGQVL